MASVKVELKSAVGPRVLVWAEMEPQDILDALPDGWTIHDDDWNNGVRTETGGMSYPLSRPRHSHG